MRACCVLRAALLLVLAGCGEESRTPVHYTPSNDKTATSKNDTTPGLAPAVRGAVEPPRKPTPPPMATALALAPLDTSSVRGSGRLAGSGRMTSVSVGLTQGRFGVTYEGAIRQGVCGRIGASVAALNPVSVDSLGAGAAATDVSVPIDSLLGSRHVVVYGPGGRPATCAPVGSPAEAPPAPRPSAPLRPDTPRPDSAADRAG